MICSIRNCLLSVARARARWAVLLIFALASGALELRANPAPVTTASALPLFFEAGPTDPDAPASFVARGPNYHFRITPASLDFMLRKPSTLSGPASGLRPDPHLLSNGSSRLMRMSFIGANSRASLSGTAEMEGKINYLIGNDPSRWRSQVSTFAGVHVGDLYPGIDLTYYAQEGQIEYDFTLAANADPGRIQLHFSGADKLSINPEGELVIALGDGELRQHRPVIYQFIKGVRRSVSGGYVLTDSQTAGFALGPYDPEAPLVIDPVFSYSTYFGGNAGDTGLAIKVDSSGSVYLAGETLSTKFPAALSPNPFQAQQHGGTSTGDAFVAKLDSTGSKLLYFTYLGGTADDGAYDLAIDPAGNAFVTGFTVSADFPTRNALFPRISGSPDPKFQVYPVEAFVAELNTNGSALIYSTYLGGSGNDLGSAIAVDPSGYTYVTGYTYSTNFPIVNAFQSHLSGNDDVFIAKFAPGGRSLVYSTYFGGFSIDEGQGIAADAAGYAYVAGYTASTNFPVTRGAWRTLLNSSGVAVSVYDAFLTKIAPNGRSLVYSTYFGGTQNDFGYRVAIDLSGNAYLVGATQSADLPHTNAFGLTLGNNGTNAINFDAFFTKFHANGQPEYTAQFGGTANDSA
ncbi:MAG TPA: SBBP repeat-containing protein, partial [Patescibacteria group bacterium]|nr:SBBP repeat-containing protein [Patescibacteria group bacterium]